MALDSLTKIAKGKITPNFKIREFAQKTIQDISPLLKIDESPVSLETDAETTDSMFLIAKDLVRKYVKDEKDISLEEISVYEVSGVQHVLYSLVLKDTADTASALDWLDTVCETYSSVDDGICVYFEIFQKTGTETAFLTKN